MRSTHLLTLAALAALSCGGAALADSAKTVGTPADTGVGDERIICKKHLETGSLVRRVKKCFTRAEWDMIAEREQVGLKRTFDDLSTKSSGQ